MPTGKQLQDLVMELAEKKAKQLGKAAPDSDDVRAAQHEVEAGGRRLSDAFSGDDADLSSLGAMPDLPSFPSSRAVGKGVVAGGGLAGAVGMGATGSWDEEDVPSAAEPATAKPSAAPSLADSLSSPAPADEVEEPRSSSLDMLKGLGARPTYSARKPNDDYVTEFQNEAIKALKISSASPEEEDAFKDELRGIKSTFAEAKSDLEKRELAHTLAEALTQLGGAAYGLRKGVDMSGLQFKAKDFSKDMAQLNEELKIQLQDLRSRRQEDLDKREKAADLSMKQADLRFKVGKEKEERADQRDRLEFESRAGAWDSALKLATTYITAEETKRNHEEMAALKREAKEAKTDEQKAKAAEKIELADEKRVQSLASKAASIINSKRAADNPEEALDAMVILISGNSNIPKDELRKKITNDGWFTDGIDADGVADVIRELGTPPSKQAMRVVYKKPGMPDQVATNEEQMKALEAKQWTRSN